MNLYVLRSKAVSAASPVYVFLCGAWGENHLFQLIDESTDPYGFVFKDISETGGMIGTIAEIESDDESSWLSPCDSTRIGDREWNDDVFEALSETDGWKSFTRKHFEAWIGICDTKKPR